MFNIVIVVFMVSASASTAAPIVVWRARVNERERETHTATLRADSPRTAKVDSFDDHICLGRLRKRRHSGVKYKYKI